MRYSRVEEKKREKTLEKNTGRGSTERGKIVNGDVRGTKCHVKLKRALIRMITWRIPLTWAIWKLSFDKKCLLREKFGKVYRRGSRVVVFH